jgi:hypothetical protein
MVPVEGDRRSIRYGVRGKSLPPERNRLIDVEGSSMNVYERVRIAAGLRRNFFLRSVQTKRYGRGLTTSQRYLGCFNPPVPDCSRGSVLPRSTFDGDCRPVLVPCNHPGDYRDDPATLGTTKLNIIQWSLVMLLAQRHTPGTRRTRCGTGRRMFGIRRQPTPRRRAPHSA